MSISTESMPQSSNIETDISQMYEFSFIKMKAHDRPITDIKFNADGDFLFSAAKDSIVCLTRMDGNIIGTYEGHNGAIMTLDPSSDTTFLATGGADKKIMLWDVNTGTEINRFSLESIVKSVSFNIDSNSILFSTDDSFSSKPIVGNIDRRSMKISQQFEINSVPTKAVSNFSNEYVVYSDNDGYCKKIDTRMGKIILEKKFHTSRINCIRNSFCNSFFITSSSDAQSKIIGYDLDVKKCFTSEDPINSSVIFKTNDKILVAGGINPRDVTLTRSKTNFMTIAFDIVTNRMIGSYSTHFGTIRSIDVHPEGKYYASGGEDGIVCIVKFGEDFENAPFTDFNDD